MKNKSVRILPIVVIFTLLFSFFAAFTVHAENKNDYSLPGYSADIYNEVCDSVEFLREKLNINIGTAESEYLTQYSDFKLSYPKNIPSSYISISVNASNPNQIFVTLTAWPYSYANSEGVSVSWTPSKASHGKVSQDFKFIDNVYKATFQVSEIEAGASFGVEYKSNLKISKEDINKELSRAYLDAKYFDYLEKQLEYESALAIYNEYLSDQKIYDELYLEYTEYLSDLKKYEESLQKYEEYLKALEQYEKDYVLYLDSLKTAEQYRDEKLAYDNYVQKMEKINYRLYLLSEMKTQKTPLKRSLHAAIMGDAVDQVLAEQDVLTGNVIGADKAAVEGAGEATREIREFYEEYFSRTSDQSKYLYYQMNYKMLQSNVVKLFRCLDNLYENEQVRTLIEMRERSEKFEILLAQLFYASNALSDEIVYNYNGTLPYDSNYRINTTKGLKTPQEILGDVSGYFVDKNIATPLQDEAFPDPVPWDPNYESLPEPTKPEKVVKPTLPAEVFEPVAPTPVEKPTEPAKADNVNSSSLKAPFEENSTEAKLLEEYREGKLVLRNDSYLTKDYVMNVSINVTKVYGASTVTVAYHDSEGYSLGSVTVDKGSFAEIGEIPTKKGDAQYSYVFEGWVDETKENSVNLLSVDRDMRIYPKFKQVVNKYKITWQIAGETIEESLEYGSMPRYPQYPQTPKKQGDLNKQYVFAGWSSEIVHVTQDAVYTALFDESYTIPGLPDGSIYVSENNDTEITVNCGALLGSKIDVSRLLEIASGKYSVKFMILTPSAKLPGEPSYAEFTVPYADVMAMKKASVAFLEFSVSKTSDAENYLVTAYGENGKALSSSFKVSLAVPTEKNHEDMRVVYYVGAEKIYVKSQYSDGKIRFNLNTGCHYSYILEVFPSLVSVLPQEIKVVVDKEEALPGEIVSVNVNLPVGTELVSIYYINSDGVRVTINDGKFSMPAFDVSVGAETKKISYTVNFISDGIDISSKEYHYGDTVTVPEGVVKASDGNFTYKFLRWTPAVSEVKANVDYVAVYERTPIIREETDGLKISEGTLRILVLAGIIGLVFVFGILPNTVISIVLLIRRKRRGTALIGKSKKLKRIE